MPESPSPWVPEQAATGKQEPDFWDNLVSGIAYALLGREQTRRSVREALGLPSMAGLKKKDIDKAVAEARPPEGWGGALGTLIASVPTSVVPGLGPLAGGVQAGIQSAISTPVQGGDFWGQKGVQTALGGAVGMAMGVLGNVLSGPASRAIEPMNKRAINAALPPGAKTIDAIGRQGVAALREAFDKAYSAVAPRLSAKIDEPLLAKLAAIEQSMLGQGMTVPQIKAFGDEVMKQVVQPLGREDIITGAGVKHIQSELSKLARSDTPLAPFYFQARQAFTESIVRSSPPSAAAELAAIDAKYPAILAIEKASDAAIANQGVFNLAQIGTATRAFDNAQKTLIPVIDEAAARGVGKLTTTGQIFSGVGLGGLARVLESWRAGQKIGEVASKAVPLAVSGLASPVERAATAVERQRRGQEEQAGIIAPEQLPEPLTAAPEPNVEDIIRQYEGATSGKSQPGEPEIDGIIDEYERKYNIDKITHVIEQQESGGRNVVSAAGAYGPMQITIPTFRQYALPGENIHNEHTNRTVGRRIVSDLYDKYGDPRAIAAAYFSGQPNYRSLKSDINGKQVASYVGDVMRRLADLQSRV